MDSKGIYRHISKAQPGRRRDEAANKLSQDEEYQLISNIQRYLFWLLILSSILLVYIRIRHEKREFDPDTLPTSFED